MNATLAAGVSPSATAYTPPLYSLTFRRFLVLAAIHGALGIWLPYASIFSTGYALVAVIPGVFFAWSRPSTAPYWALYIMGAELLWRMAAASVLWEWGKYGAVAILLIYLRERKPSSIVPATAATYFLLLLPACAATIGALPLRLAQSRISFNLSGPLLVAVGIAAFSTIPLRDLRPQRLLACFVLPILAVAARVGYRTLTAEDIVFEAEASFATSGGYGPNQVSTILGVGTLCLILLAVLNQHRWQRLVLFTMAGTVFFEAALTFSRGGVAALGCGLAALLLHFVVSPQRAARYFFGLAAVALILGVFILPRTDSWTGGALSDRFTSLNTSGRQAIAEQDLEMFLEHPILGVGTGLSPSLRPRSHFGVAAHTEFTRAIAEHGSLGVLSFLLLLGITALTYLRAPGIGPRAWTASLVVWGFANMATASLRLAASAGILALAFIDFSQLRTQDDE